MKGKRLQGYQKEHIQRKTPYRPSTHKRRKAPTAPLSVSSDKFTYTFILENEIMSVHFDKLRGEIFIRGHNIKYLNLKPMQIQSLRDIYDVLMDDEKAKSLANDYKATLGRLIADK